MAGWLVVANWKMYIQSPEEAVAFATALRRKSRLYKGADVVLAPAFPLLTAVAEKLKGSVICLGAQAVSSFQEGAHTGYISVAMLKNVGAKYVIVGHSERRSMGESDEAVQAELRAVADAGLISILCVGERERDAGGTHFSFVEAQLTSALKDFPKQASSKLVIAYEPIWAIGKSAADAMKPQELREMAIFIKKILADRFERKAALRVPILYGGSVEQGNARPLLLEGGVGGFLVGHASAQLDSFVELLKQCK